VAFNASATDRPQYSNAAGYLTGASRSRTTHCEATDAAVPGSNSLICKQAATGFRFLLVQLTKMRGPRRNINDCLSGIHKNCKLWRILYMQFLGHKYRIGS
jgi:hypothetical protein